MDNNSTDHPNNTDDHASPKVFTPPAGGWLDLSSKTKNRNGRVSKLIDSFNSPIAWDLPIEGVSPRFALLVSRAGAMITDRYYILVAYLLYSFIMHMWTPNAITADGPSDALYNCDQWNWLLVCIIMAVYGLPFLQGTLLICIYVVYGVCLCGATPGMRTWGIHVSTADKTPLTWPRVVLWHFVSILSGFCLGIGYLWALIDKQGRTWHDIAAGVVVTRTARSIEHTPRSQFHVRRMSTTTKRRPGRSRFII